MAVGIYRVYYTGDGKEGLDEKNLPDHLYLFSIVASDEEGTYVVASGDMERSKVFDDRRIQIAIENFHTIPDKPVPTNHLGWARLLSYNIGWGCSTIEARVSEDDWAYESIVKVEQRFADMIYDERDRIKDELKKGNFDAWKSS